VTVRHLLLDADDVVQVGFGPFRPVLGEVFGEDPTGWLRATLDPGAGVLDGGTPVLPLLAQRLRELGRQDDPQELYDRLWLTISPDPSVLSQIGRWRASGLTVHLATNQDSGRAAYMKTALGYDAVLDGGYYSSDLGVAKPAAGFFEAVLHDLGAEPDAVCFVDDMAVNVAGARQVGIRAVQWELDHGLPALADLLAAHGISADAPGTP